MRARISSPLLLALSLAACARTPRVAHAPQPGSPLQRVAELPESASPSERACAMRSRDAATGREYLIVRSETRTETTPAGAATATGLASAVGDYAPAPGRGAAPGPPVAALRVDCTSSRVVARLAPGV